MEAEQLEKLKEELFLDTDLEEVKQNKIKSNTRVCEEWFPIGSFKGQKLAGFAMNTLLKTQLDVLLKNIVRDWDFTIIISGQGEVRVGKSYLASQIACYWAYQMKKLYNIDVCFNLENNFIFDGQKLIEKGNYLGQNFPYSPLIFDEAGADLEGRKSMQITTQNVLDFFRECGQYNLLNILVLPEYFDLPKSIAITRSKFLIDVWYGCDKDDIFTRGYFNFHSSRKKKDLYKLGKKELNYKVIPPDFSGMFPNFFPLDKVAYRQKKQEALSKRGTKTRNTLMIQRDALLYLVYKLAGLTQQQIGERVESLTGKYMPQTTITDILARFNYLEEEE